jgi:hypothetical protein
MRVSLSQTADLLIDAGSRGWPGAVLKALGVAAGAGLGQKSMVTFILEAAIATSSLFAGLFWLASAWGIVVAPPWRPTEHVPESERSGHQVKWNGRAALCASIAAILQTILVLYQNWPPPGLVS